VLASGDEIALNMERLETAVNPGNSTKCSMGNFPMKYRNFPDLRLHPPFHVAIFKSSEAKV
jgi:hypothetical protein